MVLFLSSAQNQNLKSGLVSESVMVGVRAALPVEGVSLLLGNGLAVGKVTADPILTFKPYDFNNTEQLETEFPNLFPACVVTRAIRAMSETLKDGNLNHPPSKSEDTVPNKGTNKPCKDVNLNQALSKSENKAVSKNRDCKLNYPPSKIEDSVPKNRNNTPKIGERI